MKPASTARFNPGSCSPGSVTRRIAWRRTEGIPGAWTSRDEQVSKLFESYTRALKEANALDFDDLLLKTVELFEKSSSVRERYTKKFRYVMVDEYQDTNRPQYLLVRHLAAHHNLCVVGIPTSRSTSGVGRTCGTSWISSTTSLKSRPCASSAITDRRRSSSTRHRPSSPTIATARRRGSTRSGSGGAKILYYRAGDDLDEAEFVARTSRTALHEDPENTVAILYRTNAQSRTLEDALRRAGTPYRIIGGVRFYERKEVKDALAYLKLILNPHDDVSFRRVVNVPARGIGKGVMESLEAIPLPTEC